MIEGEVWFKGGYGISRERSSWHGVEGRFFTIPELAARDKELAAANVEAGAVAMREALMGAVEPYHITRDNASCLCCCNMTKGRMKIVPLPTPTLAALIARGRAAERKAVLEEAIKVVEECDLIMIIPSTSASLPDCYAANAQVAVVSAIRALAERQEGVG